MLVQGRTIKYWLEKDMLTNLVVIQNTESVGSDLLSARSQLSYRLGW